MWIRTMCRMYDFTGYRSWVWTRLPFSAHTLVSNPFRRSILCTLRSIVAGHVMGSPHSARNQPLSPSRSRSPSYQPRKGVKMDVDLLWVLPAVSFKAQRDKKIKASLSAWKQETFGSWDFRSANNKEMC